MFLLDEPLGAIDARLRARLRREIRRLHDELRATMIWVTHDEHEAMSLGDRVAVMRDGRLQQVAEPMTLYERPANRFVAELIGRPTMNFVAGRIAADGEGLAFRAGDLLLPVPPGWHARLRPCADRPIVLGVRPEHLVPGPAAGLPSVLGATAGLSSVRPAACRCHLHDPGSGHRRRALRHRITRSRERRRVRFGDTPRRSQPAPRRPSHRNGSPP